MAVGFQVSSFAVRAPWGSVVLDRIVPSMGSVLVERWDVPVSSQCRPADLERGLRKLCSRWLGLGETRDVGTREGSRVRCGGYDRWEHQQHQVQ